MKKILLNRSRIGFLTVAFCCFLPYSKPCGVYFLGEEYRVALLNPYVLGDEWSAFFYSTNYLNHYDQYKNGNDRQRNLAAWASYIGNGVKKADIRKIVYEVNYEDFKKAAIEGAKNQQFGKNKFFQQLLKNKHKNILNYLLLAKEYEHLSSISGRNQWDDKARFLQLNSNEIMAVKASMEAAFETELSQPICQRYAYQLLVMSAYAKDTFRFEQLYQEYFKHDHKSALADWARYHRAAMVKDPAEANYLRAISFLRCPEKRITSYNWFEKSLVKPTLKYCKNKKETAAVLGLVALKNRGRALHEIKHIVTIDPKSPLLPLLLVREVSKLEDWLLTDELTGMGAANRVSYESENKWDKTAKEWEKQRAVNKKSDLAYLFKVRDFLLELTTNKRNGISQDLANLLVGHLYLIDKKGDTAEKFLSNISSNINKRMAEQQFTEQVLLLANKENLIDDSIKAALVEPLKQLKKIKNRYLDGGRDFAALNKVLSDAFLQKGDLLTAYCFHNHALQLPSYQQTGFSADDEYYSRIRFLDWRATETDIDSAIAFIKNKHKTPFERYLASAPMPSRNALLDLRGTISFRKNDLHAALKAFEKVRRAFWNSTYDFSFHLVSDPFKMETDIQKRGKFPATKAAFVKRLIALEKEAERNPSMAAKNYLLIGKAWLNCTYHGKSWMMFCYGKSRSEWPDPLWHNSFSFRPSSERMEDVYYEGARAIEYFKKAKAATQKKEIKAQADFFIALQQSRNQSGKYLANWAKTYKTTQYFKELKATCPMLATYTGG